MGSRRHWRVSTEALSRRDRTARGGTGHAQNPGPSRRKLSGYTQPRWRGPAYPPTRAREGSAGVPRRASGQRCGHSSEPIRGAAGGPASRSGHGVELTSVRPTGTHRLLRTVAGRQNYPVDVPTGGLCVMERSARATRSYVPAQQSRPGETRSSDQHAWRTPVRGRSRQSRGRSRQSRGRSRQSRGRTGGPAARPRLSVRRRRWPGLRHRGPPR